MPCVTAVSLGCHGNVVPWEESQEKVSAELSENVPMVHFSLSFFKMALLKDLPQDQVPQLIHHPETKS